MSPMAAQDSRSTQDSQRTQFADLIRARRTELGLGLERFAARAIDPMTGEQVKAGWIHRLETGEPVKPPKLPELRALAAACDLMMERLQDAAGQQFFGMDPVWSASGEAKAYVERLARFTPDQREQLLRLMDSLVPPDQE